jgi:hypothetical protein
MKEQQKSWPKAGDKLVHAFRKRSGQVVAEVVAVDKKNRKVSVRIGSKLYPSLSAAAQVVSGHASNGWLYWGLKKQG